MIAEIDIHFLPDVNRIQKKIVISQPGIRYAQAKALVDALLADQTFQTLPLAKRQTAIDRTMTTIQGGMLEDLVLLETKTAMPNKQVFQLQFPIGEFDMVIHDPQTLTCQIFEIKHSTQTTPEQIRHLTDPEKLAACQHRYGTITKKAVLYRGQDTIINDIEYRNVKAYLNTLGQ
jgi:hypothetical protein